MDQLQQARANCTNKAQISRTVEALAEHLKYYPPVSIEDI